MCGNREMQDVLLNQVGIWLRSQQGGYLAVLLDQEFGRSVCVVIGVFGNSCIMLFLLSFVEKR